MNMHTKVCTKKSTFIFSILTTKFPVHESTTSTTKICEVIKRNVQWSCGLNLLPMKNPKAKLSHRQNSFSWLYSFPAFHLARAPSVSLPAFYTVWQQHFPIPPHLSIAMFGNSHFPVPVCLLMCLATAHPFFSPVYCSLASPSLFPTCLLLCLTTAISLSPPVYCCLASPSLFPTCLLLYLTTANSLSPPVYCCVWQPPLSFPHSPQICLLPSMAPALFPAHLILI